MCIVHGYIPNSCLNTTIIPICKNKNGNMSDTSNYRPVAVTTVVSKLLEYGAPFVKILYLTDSAQKLISLAKIAISACRDVIWGRDNISAYRDIISGRDSYLCMQRCYLWQR